MSIEDNTLIEIIPVGHANDKKSMESNTVPNASALVVTNFKGSTVTKDVFLSIDSNGEAQSVINQDANTIVPYAGSTVEFPPISWDGRYVVRGTAVYNKLGAYYYQPIGVYFTYEKYEDCDVSYIEVMYISDGFEYSYPGFEYLGYDEYEHDISTSAEYPVTYTMYATTDEYRTDRVINTASGSPFVGQFLTFNTTVNGVSSGYTVKL